MTVKRYLKNPWFYISIVLLIVAMFYRAKDQIDFYHLYQSYLSDCPPDVNIEAVRETVDSFNGYDVFIQGIGGGGLYACLIMLTVGFLFTGDFAQRLSDGSGLTEIIRIGFKRYYRREVVRNALSVFAFTVLVLMIFLTSCLLLFSARAPGYGHGMFLVTDLYFDVPFLYCVLQILNQAFYLALFSLLCMGTVCFIKNVFASRIAPLILYLFLLVIPQILRRSLRVSYFALLYPDLLFTPFNIDGGTPLGFVGEKVCAYLLLAAAVVCVHCYMYRKYRRNYLR